MVLVCFWLIAMIPWSTEAATCRAGDPTVLIDTYALIIGWPDSPPEPPSDGQQLQHLKAVPSDVLAMHAFFGALPPRCLFVHSVGVTDAQWGAFADDVKLPKCASTKRSATRIADGISKHPERPSQVYVYYAGHGVLRHRGPRSYTWIFVQPVEGSDAIGSDGEIDAPLFHDDVLEPLTAAGTAAGQARRCSGSQAREADLKSSTHQGVVP